MGYWGTWARGPSHYERVRGAASSQFGWTGRLPVGVRSRNARHCHWVVIQVGAKTDFTEQRDGGTVSLLL